MHIDAALTPADIALLPQRDLTDTTCVVFDVLRATSSMITGLASGATEIHPVCTIDEARALKLRLPDAVLGGERSGDLIPGFDVGNSPSEYTALAGQRIISTTTNGTVALRACKGAERVLVAAILNLDAVAIYLKNQSPKRVLLVCAGTFDSYAMEDGYAAGLFIQLLGEATLSDSAITLEALASVMPSPLSALRESRNGQALAAAGRAADVEWCARLSWYNVVGQMTAAVIRPLPQ